MNSKLKVLVGLVLFVSAVAWADEDQYVKALTVMTKNCAGCHQAADHPGALFLNKERLSEKKTVDLVVSVLEHKQMPPAHKQFLETEDGKTLLTWLKKKQGEMSKKAPKKTK